MASEKLYRNTLTWLPTMSTMSLPPPPTPALQDFYNSGFKEKNGGHALIVLEDQNCI